MKSLSRTYEFHSTRVKNSYGSSIPRNKTKLEFRHSYLLFSLVVLLVMFAETLSYSTIGIAYSYFQAFLVVFHLLRGKLFQAILIHILFVLTSLEWPADLALGPVIYTYRTVSIFGITISTITLGLLFFAVVSKTSFHFKLRRTHMWFFLLFFFAILTGVMGLVFSDYSLSYFISDLQYWMVLLMSAVLGFAFFSSKRAAASIFEKLLLFVLCSRSVIGFFGSFLGFQKGMYGGIATFTYDAIDLLIPLIILAIFRKNSSITTKLLISLCWSLGILKTLMFGGSGKGLMLISGVFAVLLLKTLSSRVSILAKLFTVALLMCVVFLIVLALPNVLENNLLFSIKYNQVASLLSFSWIKNPYELPPSPRDRVLEFYNSAAFYSEYPLFILTGRGFGGYFEDKAFYNYTASDKGGYSTEEVKTRKFVNPHESLNVVFLKFGLSGVVIWVLFLVRFLGTRRRHLQASLLIRSSGFVLVFLVLGFSLKLAFLIGFCIASMVGGEASSVESALC